MSATLDSVARRYGIALTYQDIDGTLRHASPEALRRTLTALGVALDISAPLDVAPRGHDSLNLPRKTRCFVPDWLARGRAWGIIVQLYQLRSDRNWGIGDFQDLKHIATCAARLGADFVGLNPLHALFAARPDHISPFSPSNRRFLNPLYIALDSVPGIEVATINPDALRAVRDSNLVDYPTVSRLKLTALREAWQAWPDSAPHDGPYTRTAFMRFCDAEGEPLRLHAVYEALSCAMAAEGSGADWLSWPAPYRDAKSEPVWKFATDHVAEIGFHTWLQWLADVQLGEAHRKAREGGMRIGLYLDFAVGEAPDGSAAWGDPAAIAPGLRIGAPPDMFNAEGQDWGLAPYLFSAPAEAGVRRYRDVIAQVMRHAGALRIDHAMGIHRLFVIPPGLQARDGVYVHLPFGAIIAALADASRGRRTIVIGEDLGTVPDGFRSAMSRCEMQAYRVLYFERERGRLRRPNRYPRKALACLSTHDLPPLKGWWEAEDIVLRQRLGLIDKSAERQLRCERQADRETLMAQLRRSDLRARQGGRASQSFDIELSLALHAHLARAPSRLFAIRLEDLAGEHLPVNIPGTTQEYPNWQRKLSISVETLITGEHLSRMARAVAAARPRLP